MGVVDLGGRAERREGRVIQCQIGIGPDTVAVSGIGPWGDAGPTHAAHLVAALTIFTLLSLTTIYAYRDHHSRPPRARSRRALGVALVALLISGLFSRGVPLLQYSTGAQAWYYAVSLVAVVGLLATVYWLADVDQLGRAAAGSALGIVVVTMLIGRDLVVYTPTVQLLNFGLYVAALGLVAGGLWRLFGRSQSPTPSFGTEHSE